MRRRLLWLAALLLALAALPLLLPLERVVGAAEDDDPLRRQLCALAELYAGPTARVARLHWQGGSHETAATLVARIRRIERLCGPTFLLPDGFERLSGDVAGRTGEAPSGLTGGPE